MSGTDSAVVLPPADAEGAFFPPCASSALPRMQPMWPKRDDTDGMPAFFAMFVGEAG